ncbi:extracellular solute-binding protein [Paenibacillus hexagrammi]|uniref:Extracellular solute-binding protein n=1 Tax=Paenibacillus hexagrammi TaxID=2908839 RepID=A0ABY3SBS3_9BACL|nr:extracellular solute-binding protein [Paenibacillus sp. YPD9-1]UJF31409.1 extracellular solute-binding protein [Paenibacillus sp. YPD9-1]
MMLASGDLPDVIAVDATQLKQLADAGQIEDMTALYETYASPFTKEILSQEGLGPFDAATINGRLMAIPQVGSSTERAMFIWIRTDWLEKLGLKPPQTLADVQAISKAFTEQDPDGNGIKDTYGLGITKFLWGGAMALEGFMAGYDAYPNIWVENGSGQLVYGSLQPQVKKALEVLQTMYKNGELDPEFGMKDGGKVAEQISNGKIGLEYGQQWNSIYPLQLNRNQDSKAQWQAFPIVTESGEVPKVPLPFSTNVFFAVKKDVQHPEAVIKLFNLFLEKNWGQTEDFSTYYAPEEAESVWQLSPVTASPSRKNLTAFREIEEARKKGDMSQLKGEARTIQQKLDAFASGAKAGFALWGWERIYGPHGAQAVLDQYDRNNQFLLEKFIAGPTPTMVDRKSVLDKLQDRVFTRIIMGSPLEEFDKFVEDWNELGGSSITREVNAWYASKRKE